MVLSLSFQNVSLNYGNLCTDHELNQFEQVLKQLIVNVRQKPEMNNVYMSFLTPQRARVCASYVMSIKLCMGLLLQHELYFAIFTFEHNGSFSFDYGLWLIPKS